MVRDPLTERYARELREVGERDPKDWIDGPHHRCWDRFDVVVFCIVVALAAAALGAMAMLLWLALIH